ncbi:hypothetical protein JNK13_09355 [bacterium]|nr:hypothetical protein [bacterium]
MAETSRTEQIILGVVGKPIAHSNSPVIHQLGFKQANVCGASVRLITDSSLEALTLARELKLSGINVTAPYKAELAKHLGAQEVINTIVFDTNQTRTYNTDPSGIIRALEECEIKINRKVKSALIIGSGGAAISALKALSKKGLTLNLAARNETELKQLAADYKIEKSFRLEDKELTEALQSVDLILSTVSTGERIIPAAAIKPKHLVFDAYYAAPSSLLADAENVGATIIPPQTWLIEQGLEALKCFGLEITDKNQFKSDFFEATQFRISSKTSTPKPLALIGMMGSGKSSVAKMLAQVTNKTALDLDQSITDIAGKSIPEIFSTQGEAAFRQLEETCLSQALQQKPAIIACGGGVILSAKNRSRLIKETLPIWLYTDQQTSLQRIKNPDSRPLLTNADFAELFRLRHFNYAQTAHSVIDSRSRNVENITQKILEEYNHYI